MRENKMRRRMAGSFLSALKEDIIPWERGWDLQEARQNATTGNRYRGSNHLWLNYVAKEQGYSDPRWCAFIQAKEKGWRIKKGEKGIQIEIVYLSVNLSLPAKYCINHMKLPVKHSFM